MKKHVLIIGAGGVAQVVAHKCAENNNVLGDIHIASRTLAKCEAIVASVREKATLKSDGAIVAHALDAMDVEATKALIESTGARIVINVGSAFLNMSILSACIATGTAYVDTAIHEDPLKVCETPPWYANYEWKRREECEKAGVTAVLGAGFDPGVVNAYARLVVGRQKAYLTGHDEVHSLSQNLGVPNVRFWMGFGDHHINVFTVLKNLGFLSQRPVRTAEGVEVVPLKVVKAVLPDPSSLAPDYTGKTCIGDLVKGVKDGKECEIFIYNIADHTQAFEEVGSQGSPIRPACRRSLPPC